MPCAARLEQHFTSAARGNKTHYFVDDGGQRSRRLDYVRLDICWPRHSLVAMATTDKPLVWLRGEVKTPPFTATARLEAGALLRRLQHGEKLGMPHSRPMPAIGPRCHELRIVDAGKTWRLVYRLDPDAVVIADVFQKTTQQTPVRVIADSARRLKQYDQLVRED